MAEIISFCPSLSIFGFGAVKQLPEILDRKNVHRLLIFTDAHIAKSGILQQVLDLLPRSIECEVFDKVPAEPHSRDMEHQKNQLGTGYDVLLGLGGGSVMDFTKAMSIIMTHDGSLGDYLGEGSLPGPVVPVICVPTTSGTGSQNSQTTVFTIDGVKRGVSSEYIRPAASVVDPELTMDLPPEVTRNSGYDALMHACESFIARPSADVPERPILYQGSNPFSRALALEAFRHIWTSYKPATTDGKNREARAGMSIGSHMAGMAFSHSGLGLVHALASSLGGMIDAPHGVCLAACTAMGLKYNFEYCKDDLAVLATITGEDKGHDQSFLAGRFLDRLHQLLKELNFPTRPSELGIGPKDAEALLQNTLLQTRRIQTNPRPLDDALLDCIQAEI
jgi:alcohol dehydrogenase class IV